MDLAEFFLVPVDYFTSNDDLRATAMWLLGRMGDDELRDWVSVLMRRTQDPLPPRE